jgi:hypothetical protein
MQQYSHLNGNQVLKINHDCQTQSIYQNARVFQTPLPRVFTREYSSVHPAVDERMEERCGCRRSAERNKL